MYSWPSISAEFAQLGAFRTDTGLQSRESGLWLDWHHGNTEESLRRLRINPSAELALWVKRINPCSYCCFWRPRSHHLPLYLAVFLQASSELHPGADTSAVKEICDEISCRTWLYLSPKKNLLAKVRWYQFSQTIERGQGQNMTGVLRQRVGN